ncbi:marvel domain-containing protein [Xylariaceae sp. FL0255]|nr:marvel domain-containing protein [Xylariaceae sp. FL0255]
MSNVAAIAFRGLFVLSSVIVLALSVDLAKQQVIGSPPAETSFDSFAGAFGVIASFVAILALFIKAVPRIAVIALDALASVFFLAGAVALTVALKPVSSCTSNSQTARGQRYVNKLLNGGCRHDGDNLVCPNAGKATNSNNIDSYTSGRCQMVQADYVFGYIGFVFGVASVFLSYLAHKRGGVSTTATYV